jgi:hypothetical protein
MAEFKPMVKMETSEPSVMLKLKKGGHVDMKSRKGDGDHKSMKHMAMGGAPMGMGGMPITSPAARALGQRRRPMMTPPPIAPMTRPGAMNTPVMKKGGKVHGKADGGYMETAKEQKAENRKIQNLSKELHQHESQKAGKAHHGLKDGGKVSGSKIDSFGARSAIEGNEGKFLQTKVVGAKRDTAHGIGQVKEKNAGGYKRGGKVGMDDCYADGGTVPASRANAFMKTKVVDGDMHDSAHGTGRIKVKNAGGYKAGGPVGGWENRPANGTPPGKTGGNTGEVRNTNAGGYKMGGAAKKAYATGGTVSSGKPVAMPQGRKPPSAPVSISRLSGTFKNGGKVGRYADGDLIDASKGAYDKAIGPSAEDMDMAKAIRNVPRKLYEGAKGMLGFGATKPAGSVTKTEKSVTVAPAGKKRGGRC